MESLARSTSAMDRVKLVSLKIGCGTAYSPSQAALELEIDGIISRAQGTGGGPVDAAFKCIKKLVPTTATLQLYQVHAVTGGTDAQAKVTVRLEEKEGRIVHGQGADTDTLVASVRAYVNALNKLFAAMSQHRTLENVGV